jgi:hypothetical protein
VSQRETRTGFRWRVAAALDVSGILVFLIWFRTDGHIGTKIPHLKELPNDVQNVTPGQHEVYSFPSSRLGTVVSHLRQVLGREEDSAEESADAGEELIWTDAEGGWKAVLYKESIVSLANQFTKAAIPPESGVLVVRHASQWPRALLARVRSVFGQP